MKFPRPMKNTPMRHWRGKLSIEDVPELMALVEGYWRHPRVELSRLRLGGILGGAMAVFAHLEDHDAMSDIQLLQQILEQEAFSQMIG